MNFRPERVQGLIQEELSKLILKEVEVPGVILTITSVEVSKKLDLALVKVSVFPSEQSNEALETLRHRTPFLQRTLLRQINIKPMPQIRFEIDEGIQNAARVEKLLLEDDNHSAE
jgi:ribosome-binding factor A